MLALFGAVAVGFVLGARAWSRARRPSRYLNVVLSGMVLAGAIVMPMSAAPIETPTPLQSGEAASARVGPFTFAIGPYALRLIPEERLPYYGASIVPSCGLTDPSGVAMYRASDGEIYNHPVAQTRCALNMQRNYRLTGDQAYLDTSIANAQRLLDRAVTHQGALFSRTRSRGRILVAVS